MQRSFQTILKKLLKSQINQNNNIRMKTFIEYIVFVLSLLSTISLTAQVNQYDSLGNKTGKWITHYKLTDSIFDVRYPVPKMSIVSDFSDELKHMFSEDKKKRKLKNIVLVENYTNNKKNGYFYLYLNDTILSARGYYHNGVLSGERQFFVYDSNGIVRCDVSLTQKNGKLNGPQILFFGEMISISPYHNGKEHGKSVTYDTSGDVIYVINFENGNLVDNVNFYIADSITFFTNRKKDEFTRVYENGYWVEKIYHDYHKTIKEPSQFERIFDINRLYLFFHRKKLKKEYHYDFHINIIKKE